MSFLLHVNAIWKLSHVSLMNIPFSGKNISIFTKQLSEEKRHHLSSVNLSENESALSMRPQARCDCHGSIHPLKAVITAAV